MVNPSRSRWLAFGLITLLLGTVMSLAAAEITLRVLGIGYGSAPLIGHPVFHHWHERDYRMTVWDAHGEFGGHEAFFNHDGFAMKEELPPPQPSLLFLGDSYTEGMQVPESSRWVTQVASHFGLPGLNFGCGSFTPLLSRLEVDAFKDRIRPKAVVLQLYSNDIDDDISYRKGAILDDKGKVIAIPGEAKSALVRWGRKSYLVRLLRKAWLTRQFQKQRDQRSAATAAPAPKAFAYFDKPLDRVYSDAARHGIEESILDLAAYCREAGCAFFLFVVPDKGALTLRTADYFHDYFLAFAQRNGIRFIDLNRYFAGKNLDELYFAKDIHFTQKGHDAVAQAVIRELSSTLKAPRSLSSH